MVSVPLSTDFTLPETSGSLCVSVSVLKGVGVDIRSQNIGPGPGVLKGVLVIVSNWLRKEGHTKVIGVATEMGSGVGPEGGVGNSLQKLPVSRILGDARNNCLERHSSSLHHSCSLRGLLFSTTLSALKPGSHSRSHFARKGFELKLLLSPLFHSLSAKQNRKHSTMKTESKGGRRGLKGWFICVSDLPVPGTFSSAPTAAMFPIRSRAKFPELLNPNRNQSIISGFPLGGFRLTAPWARKPDLVLIPLSMFSFRFLY